MKLGCYKNNVIGEYQNIFMDISKTARYTAL